jgi:hypothetical protein
MERVEPKLPAVRCIAWLGAGRDIVGVNELRFLSVEPLQEAFGVVEDRRATAELDIAVFE